MRERKNALLLFSKVPEPGLVKTRLTTLKDGIFTPEVAARLYHCMLFDVVEIICSAMTRLEERSAAASDVRGQTGETTGAQTAQTGEATGAHIGEQTGGQTGEAQTGEAIGEEIRDTYELVISTTPAENVAVMRKLFDDAGTWPRELIIIADEGANFDEHYNHAFSQTWDRGADTIMSMGADMPALTVNDVIAGFDALHRIDSAGDAPAPAGSAPAGNSGSAPGGIVLAPDQEMGVSVVGWTRNTAFDHTGVFYNQDGLTVLPAYIKKARELGLAAYYLPPIPDVDTMADLRHNVTLVEALNYCAKFDGNTPPWRTADALDQIGWSEIRVMPNGLFDPRGHIDVAQDDA